MQLLAETVVEWSHPRSCCCDLDCRPGTSQLLGVRAQSTSVHQRGMSPAVDPVMQVAQALAEKSSCIINRLLGSVCCIQAILHWHSLGRQNSCTSARCRAYKTTICGEPYTNHAGWEATHCCGPHPELGCVCAAVSAHHSWACGANRGRCRTIRAYPGACEVRKLQSCSGVTACTLLVHAWAACS